jgi:DNA repair protein RadA/Sms
MAKARSIFVCQNCAYQAPRWLGRCPECDQWNTLIEEATRPQRNAERAAPAPATPVSLASVSAAEESRLPTGIGELDRVLGGGLVSGSVVLLGGDPGIGKSTLALQALHRLGAAGHSVLYVTGEESARQTRMRGERLGLTGDKLLVLAESSLEPILAALEQTRPAAAVIDSIQTLHSADLGSAPGSVSQVREVAARIIERAKAADIAVILVGHVTKDGALAGPKTLEHLVDAVLAFEGDPGHATRILRGVKNRFGGTDEIGVFEMRARGLEEVSNPSRIFLAGLLSRETAASGSVVAASLEGSRPLLVEVQALVSPTRLSFPRRAALGVEEARVAMLVAVMEKKAGFDLSNQDLYLNVAGGVRILEPAVDLAVVAAVASSFLDAPIAGRVALAGEVGLTGEARAVVGTELRAREAARLGFDRIMLPVGGDESADPAGIAVERVATVADLLAALFPGASRKQRGRFTDA